MRIEYKLDRMQDEAPCMLTLRTGTLRLHDLNLTIRRCQEGEAEAWRELVEHFQGRVYAVCLYYLRHRDDAVDASQEVFVKVFNKLGDFNGESETFLAWMLSIARNSCIDRLRANETRTRYQSAYGLTVDEVDRGTNPEQEMDKNQQQQLLYRALATFTEVNRDVVLLKDIQGLSLEEVARILHLPIGTIKSRSNRARIKLGKLLAELKP